jgi:hypothetical protein
MLKQEQLPSPDMFDLDLGMALAAFDDTPTSPSAHLVPDGMDSEMLAVNADDLLLDDLVQFDTAYDSLGKFVATPAMPTVTVGGSSLQQQLSMRTNAPQHAFLGGGRATPSPFSTSSEGSSCEMPRMIKDEELALLLQPPQASQPTPEADDQPALTARVQQMFPKMALRSSPCEWKVFRSRVKGLSKAEQKVVATLRRKELSCVYAEKARQRRIKNLRSTGEDNQKLKAMLDAKDNHIASLEKQLRDLRKKSGGRR